MKRLFLLFALAVMSTSMFAQALDLDEWQLTMPKAIDGDQLVSFSIEEGESVEGVIPQARTKSSGLYYQKPEGVLYRRYYSDTGTTYSNTQLIAPYFHDIKFENFSNDTNSTHWLYTKGDPSSLLEANSWGDVTFAGLTPGNTWNIPYLYNADYSQYYNMAYFENVDYATDYSHTVYGSGHFNDLNWMGWSDTKVYYEFNTTYDNYYILGTVSAKDRTVTLADSDGNSTGERVTIDLVGMEVRADFPAPASPMYVDAIYVHGVSFAFDNPTDAQDNTFQPLRNGATLMMTLTDRWVTGEVMDTLTATTGDWTYYSSKSSNYRSGTCMNGVLKFSKKDENGNVVPIVIDYSTRIRIFGFDNTDIDLGLHGNVIADCDVQGSTYSYSTSYAENIMTDPTGEYNLLGVYDFMACALAVSFNGIMDRVKVAEDYSNITISADGKECENTDAQGDANIGGLLIQTALPWYDANGEANYSLADAPEWITGIAAEAYGEESNTYKVAFTAAPNKSVERTATVHIQCKGYADDVDITLTQLEGDENTGIEEIVAPSATTSGVTFNLAGQRVGGTAKGIIIKDGKKILVK